MLSTQRVLLSEFFASVVCSMIFECASWNLTFDDFRAGVVCARLLDREVEVKSAAAECFLSRKSTAEPKLLCDTSKSKGLAPSLSRSVTQSAVIHAYSLLNYAILPSVFPHSIISIQNASSLSSLLLPRYQDIDTRDVAYQRRRCVGQDRLRFQHDRGTLRCSHQVSSSDVDGSAIPLVCIHLQLLPHLKPFLSASLLAFVASSGDASYVPLQHRLYETRFQSNPPHYFAVLWPTQLVISIGDGKGGYLDPEEFVHRTSRPERS